MCISRLGTAGILYVFASKNIIMADNKTSTDNRDRTRVASNEDYELSYLEEQLGVSREQVKDAIKEVGSDRKRVEEYLTKNR